MYDWRRFAKFLHSNSGKVRDDNEKLGGGEKKKPSDHIRGPKGTEG